MKCNDCGEEKELDAFPWRNKGKGIKQKYCKECKKKYNQKWYANPENKKKQIARAALNKKSYLEKMYEWKMRYIFSHGGCSWENCGIMNPFMIHFDHLDKETKEIEISKMFSKGMPLWKVEAEVAKCRLLCANHHALWTAAQHGYYLFVNGVFFENAEMTDPDGNTVIGSVYFKNASVS